MRRNGGVAYILKQFFMLRSFSFLIFSLLVCVTTNSCTAPDSSRYVNPTDEEVSRIPLGIDIKPFVAANTALGIDCYRQLTALEKSFVISPYGLSKTLVMALLGASGKTKEQIIQVAQWGHLDPDPFLMAAGFFGIDHELQTLPPPYILMESSSLWTSPMTTILPSYMQIVEDVIGPITVVDTTNPNAATSTINYWIEKQTLGQILSLVDNAELPTKNSFLLTSGLAIKAPWNTLLSSETPQRLRYFEDDQMVLCEVPFTSSAGQDTHLTCLLLVAKNNDLSSIESNLDKLPDWRSAMSVKKVAVLLTDVQITSHINCREILEKLGLKLAFDAQEADFSLMSDQHHLHLEQLMHAAQLHFDQYGVNGGETSHTSSFDVFTGEPTLTVSLEKSSFIFMIFHEPSDTLLFIGRNITDNATTS